jgi:hypothetical protein
MNIYDFYGNNGYQRTFNNHAMNVLARPINIPDAALGIGSAEVTKSVPLLVSYTPQMKAPELVPVKSIDDTFVKTQGQGLQISSFINTGYYGEAIGGF